MRYRSLLPSALALSAFWLAACGDDTMTEPTTARPAPGAPELAIVSNTWLTRANNPTNRTEFATATVTNAAGQSIVYVIGGLNQNGIPVKTVTAYNVTTNSWTYRQALPVQLAGSNGAGVINGKVYVSGGYSDIGGDFPKAVMYMYDPATNSWARKHDMPDIAADNAIIGGGGATGVISGKLYVATPCYWAMEPWGYYEGCGEGNTAQFFRYNPVTDRWATLPSPFGIHDASPFYGGVINGKFYVMWGSFSTREGQFAVYDPATNQWTSRHGMALIRRGAAAAVLGGKFYVLGGERYNAETERYETLDLTTAYNPTTDSWAQRARLPSPRKGIAATTVRVSGQQRIEVLGGAAPGNNLQYVP